MISCDLIKINWGLINLCILVIVEYDLDWPSMNGINVNGMFCLTIHNIVIYLCASCVVISYCISKNRFS